MQALLFSAGKEEVHPLGPLSARRINPSFILPAKLAMGSVCSLIFYIFRIGN